MNILILQQSMGIGGVNVVSATLAVKFQQEGHQVDVFAFYEGRNDMPRENYGNVPIHIGHGFKVNKENVETLRQIILNRKIELIINQWGLTYAPTAILKKACKGTCTKWISYYHSNPFFNGRIQSVAMALSKENVFYKRFLFRSKLVGTKKITALMMRHNYDACWRFMVLSESYIRNFQLFTGLKHTEKLRVISNPVTIDTNGFVFKFFQKSKDVIFVGRLDPEVKRVSRIVSAWSLIEASFPDWRLKIIGDGPERSILEKIVSDNMLKHILLEGTQQPRPYYESASILVMTSDFEGFPLVLAEAMTFGVIPVIYDSFEALHDIVDDGKNGLIVPKVNGSFSVELMAEKLRCLMSDDIMREELMRNAIERSKDFNIDGIYNKWVEIFNELKA